MNKYDNEARIKQLEELGKQAWYNSRTTPLNNPVPYVIKTKLLNKDAQIPTKNNKLDAGYDLYSTEDVEIGAGKRKVVKTGVSFQIPDGYAGLIWPRSGLSVKKGIDVLAGVIDSTYRGEIMVCLYNTQEQNEQNDDCGSVVIKKGDRIAQILFQKVPHFKLEQVENLEDTERGNKGFGSSGE